MELSGALGEGGYWRLVGSRRGGWSCELEST